MPIMRFSINKKERFTTRRAVVPMPRMQAIISVNETREKDTREIVACVR